MSRNFNKLLIIDGSYCLHRNLHMEDVANLTTSTGVKSGGIFGFLRSLNKMLKNSPSDYFPVICWDSRVSQRRLDLYPNYKHNLDKQVDRNLSKISVELITNPQDVEVEKFSDSEIAIIKEKVAQALTCYEKFGTYSDPDDYVTNYVQQRDKVIEICNLLGIPNVKIKNWEGDDLMTLFTRISDKSIIVSDDSDMQQLVSDRVRVLKVLKDVHMVDLNEIVNGRNYPDGHFIAIVKAIVGDSSDNIPQVAPRVGTKTAEKIASIIYRHDRLEDALDEIKSTLKGSGIAAFVENWKDYARNLGLVDLNLVENDLSVIDSMIAAIMNARTNYVVAMSKLAELEIGSVDVSSIVNRVVSSKLSVVKGDA